MQANAGNMEPQANLETEIPCPRKNTWYGLK